MGNSGGEICGISRISRLMFIMRIVGPHYVELFNQISQHVCTLVRDNDAAAEPAMKKRRLDGLESRPAGNANGMNGNGHSTAPNGSAPVPVEASSADPVLLEVKDISVVIPQRKKYTLCFTASHLYAKLPGSSEPAAGMSFAWNDIGAFLFPSLFSFTSVHLCNVLVQTSFVVVQC
jgi:hypothetical protein